MFSKSTRNCVVVFSVLMLVVGSNTQTRADFVVDSNGAITDATITDGSTTYNIEFIAGSYNTVNSLSDLSSTPWYTPSGSIDSSVATFLSNQLDAAMESYISAPTGVSLASGAYAFAWYTETPFSADMFQVTRYSTEEGVSPDTQFSQFAQTWGDENEFSWGEDETLYTAPFYWATISSGTSTVPEPSTAIAMGLLGIVGFAGNRRRRRQGSVA